MGRSVVAHYITLIAGLEAEITAKMADDDMRKQALEAERDAERAENMLLHESEISSRPARTWHQTESEKKSIREASRAQTDLEKETAKVGYQEATAAQKAQIDLEKETRISFIK